MVDSDPNPLMTQDNCNESKKLTLNRATALADTPAEDAHFRQQLGRRARRPSPANELRIFLCPSRQPEPSLVLGADNRFSFALVDLDAWRRRPSDG